MTDARLPHALPMYLLHSSYLKYTYMLVSYVCMCVCTSSHPPRNGAVNDGC